MTRIREIILIILVLLSCISGVYGEEIRGIRHGDYELYSGTDVTLTYEAGYVTITASGGNEVLYIFTHMFATTEQLMQAFAVLVESRASTAAIQKGYAHTNEEDWLLAWTPQSGYMYTKFGSIEVFSDLTF
ncbi:MAG: hypothetical protein LBV40_06930 [Methanomicrobiales archaeon]|jgi:hypothetical protein|nr:hypothetical protein [Methanomicrobiales archaeon]